MTKKTPAQLTNQLDKSPLSLGASSGEGALDVSPGEKTTRPGYKHTKLGWIPVEWKVVPVSRLFKITSGGTPKRDEFAYWHQGSIPWVTTSEIANQYIFESRQKITNKAVSESSAKIFPEKTMLMAMYGQGVTRGKVGILGIAASTNQACAAFTKAKELIDVDFAFQYFILKYKWLRSLSNDGGQQNLSAGLIKSIKIPLPPLPEQHRIATLLTTWDRAITTTQALIDQLETRKRGLMQRLLTGEVRLPGFSGEWRKVKLGDVTQRVTTKNKELNDTVVTISAQRGFVKQEDFFNKRVASNTLSGYYLLKKGQFAYNKSYSKGYPMGAFKRLDAFDKAVVTTLYICFSIKNSVDSDFLINYFEGGRLVKNLMRIAQEGGRAHGLLNISLKDFFALEISLPPLEEQTGIAAVLTATDQEITLQREKLAQLQRQKRGLMQQLLTGQKRLLA